MQSLFINQDFRLIREIEVLHICGVCRNTLVRMINDGEFPPPIQQGRFKRWRSDEIDKWLESVSAERQAEQALKRLFA